MGALDILIHSLNFAAPALGVALWMLLFYEIRKKVRRPPALPAAPGWVQLLVNFSVGLLTLAGGLWIFGRDGMMATYGALVCSVSASQWVLNKGWRA